MSRVLTAVFLGTLGLVGAGCSGWHIRGTEGAELAVDRVSLSQAGAPVMRAALARQLIEYGVDVVGSAAPADARILLNGEEFDRRVLSVDPETGRVREVELELTLVLTVRDARGEIALGPDRVQLQRDYVFEETSLLGNVEQERLLRNDLAEDAALTILLRLEALEDAP